MHAQYHQFRYLSHLLVGRHTQHTFAAGIEAHIEVGLEKLFYPVGRTCGSHSHLVIGQDIPVAHTFGPGDSAVLAGEHLQFLLAFPRDTIALVYPLAERPYISNDRVLGHELQSGVHTECIHIVGALREGGSADHVHRAVAMEHKMHVCGDGIGDPLVKEHVTVALIESEGIDQFVV